MFAWYDVNFNLVWVTLIDIISDGARINSDVCCFPTFHPTQAKITLSLTADVIVEIIADMLVMQV